MNKLILAAALSAISAASFAAPETFNVEPTHTYPRFEYTHFGYAPEKWQPEDVVRWYFGDRQRLAEVEAIVIENNVTEFVLSKAKTVDKTISFDELMGQQDQ